MMERGGRERSAELKRAARTLRSLAEPDGEDAARLRSMVRSGGNQREQQQQQRRRRERTVSRPRRR